MPKTTLPVVPGVPSAGPARVPPRMLVVGVMLSGGWACVWLAVAVHEVVRAAAAAATSTTLDSRAERRRDVERMSLPGKNEENGLVSPFLTPHHVGCARGSVTPRHLWSLRPTEDPEDVSAGSRTG